MKINPQHTFDIADYLNAITEAIEKSTHQVDSNNTKYSPKPWWNAKLQKLWYIKQQK